MIEKKDEIYCFKCGELAEFEIEVKREDGKFITTQNICESCLIDLIAGTVAEEEIEL